MGKDKIFKIASQCATDSDGGEAFLVLLADGGKRVKRTREELEELAPELLRAFDRLSSSSSTVPTPATTTKASGESSEDDDSDIEILESPATARKDPSSENDFAIIISPRRHGKSISDKERREREREEELVKARIRKLKGKGKEIETVVIESDEDEEESASGDDDAASFEEPESSPSVSDSDEDSNNSATDYDRSKKQKKVRREPTRKSSRRATRPQKKNFHRESSEQESSTFENEDFVRRTTRMTKPIKSTTRDASSSEENESSDEMTLKTLVSQSKSNGSKLSNDKKKVSTGKPTEDSDAYEEDDDEDDNDEINSSSDETGLIQLEHRDLCHKCGKGPADGLISKFNKRQLAKQAGKGRKRKRGIDEDDTDQEEETLNGLGAWMECNVCIDAYHFNCLPGALQKEITDGLKAEHEALHQKSADMDVDVDGSKLSPIPVKIPPRKKIEKETGRVMSLAKCWSCKKPGGRRCFVCGVSGRKRLVAAQETKADAKDSDSPQGEAHQDVPGMLFRCLTCNRVSHYACLEDDGYSKFEVLAEHYFTAGQCHDCYKFTEPLDVILAWAESDPLANSVNDVEKGDIRSDFVKVKKKDDKGKMYIMPNHKDPSSNAKYLVKFQKQSYRQLVWINHAFLAAKFSAKLKNFLAKGSQISFDLPNEEDEAEPEGAETEPKVHDIEPQPDPEAMSRIPKAWSTVDRVLEVEYRSPVRHDKIILHRAYSNLPKDPEESIKLVSQCYFKWKDLPYSASTTEVPPEKGEDGYEEYKAAYKAFLISRSPSMLVPNMTQAQRAILDKPRTEKFRPLKVQPAILTGGQLKGFQLEGLNFMYQRWWIRKGCFLADEMGLGKTIQIIALLGMLSSQQGARPFLVAVPNSTVGNWMREFALWAPTIRVVSYAGDAVSRKIIEDFELFVHNGSLKTQVVVATYEAIEQNSSVFRKVTRWDTLVVDEGQRMKGGTDGLLWKALGSLNINLRILLSGTPMQNNIRELFNMLHFVDPDNYSDIKALELKYSSLTPALIEEIRTLLKPYLLRRTKKIVLDLPPMTEIVLPVTLTDVQRTIYKSILKKNVSSIEALFHAGAGKGVKVRKQNLNNAFMELRKLTGHPYLLSVDMERTDLSEAREYQELIQASAKLILLEKLLPKLKAAGHRVLIFSQFKIVLNILERFLGGMRVKYIRLDGNTPSLDRQRGIDAYNAPDSTYFIYLLSTRAGGAGINLATADTVILYDQDFNPQQDLQATSRAHRYGQKNHVRVFKLLCKGTVEEKIFKAANKKLGLDHLIIQRIDASSEESDDIESVLQYGAKEMFDDEAAEAQAIRYSDQDIDRIIAAEPVKLVEGEDASSAFFSSTKIWEKGGVAEIDDDEEIGEQATDGTFWTNLLKETELATAAALAAKEANVGRGKRTRAKVLYDEKHEIADALSPTKKQKTGSESDADFAAAASDDEEEDDVDANNLVVDDSLVERVPQQNRPKQVQPQVPFDPNAPPPKPKRVRKPKALVAPIAPLVELGADTSLPNGGSEYARLQQLQRLKEQAKRDQQKFIHEQRIRGGPSLAQFEAHDQEKVKAHRENLGRLAAGCLKYNTPELQRLFDRALAETDFPASRQFVEQAAFLLDGLMKKALRRASVREALENAHAQAKIVVFNPRPPSSITNGQSNGQIAIKPFSSGLGLAGSSSGSRQTFTQVESQFFVAVPEASRGGLASPGRIASTSNGVTTSKIASNSKPNNAVGSSSTSLSTHAKKPSMTSNGIASTSNSHKNPGTSKKVEPATKVKEKLSVVKKVVEKKEVPIVKKPVEKKSLVIDLTLDDSDSD